MSYEEYKRRRMDSEARAAEQAGYAARYAREKRQAAASGRQMNKPMPYFARYLWWTWVIPLAVGSEVYYLVHGDKTAWIVLACVTAPFALAGLVFVLVKVVPKLWAWNLRYLGYASDNSDEKD